MTTQDDIKYMKRCLELASNGGGLTYPNPMVGSVVVHNGKIIGEGYHLKSGGPHAEVIAIGSVKDKSLLKASSLYVNLEPCSHFGKTPPCADLITTLGIPRVVVGTRDTNEKVAGKGIAMLRKAGCEVVEGVLEPECREVNRRFFTFHEKRRPYITLKWAQSADGFIDRNRSKGEAIGPNWITGKTERILVHRWRSHEQAILIGAGTLRTDHPKLNVREWKGNNPVRIILSSSGNFDEKLIDNETNGTTIVFTHNNNAYYETADRIILDRNNSSASQICNFLCSRGIESLFVEGGAQTLSHFLAEGLWDEARVFNGKKCFGAGIKAPVLNAEKYVRKIFPGSTLDIYLKEVS
jgi:diaminohydroxyphosphoribosylaminopyrimidine deaminase/5-amino-6-(5-phosphoribosylamino)uracil reductase